MPERGPETSEPEPVYWFTILKPPAPPKRPPDFPDGREPHDGLGLQDRRKTWVGARMAVDGSENHLVPRYVQGTRTITLETVWVEFSEAMRALREIGQETEAEYFEGIHGKRSPEIPMYFLFPAADGELKRIEDHQLITQLPLPEYNPETRLGI